MPSPRLAAFAEELAAAMRAQHPRAEALILRVPGEGQPALPAPEEVDILLRVADGLAREVQAWVEAMQRLAAAERAWGPAGGAREAGRAFGQASERMLALWEELLLVQPATEPMRHVLGLAHQGCYELWLSGPRDLERQCGAILAGEAPARLTFEPRAPALGEATHELRRLRDWPSPSAREGPDRSDRSLDGIDEREKAH